MTTDFTSHVPSVAYEVASVVTAVGATFAPFNWTAHTYQQSRARPAYSQVYESQSIEDEFRAYAWKNAACEIDATTKLPKDWDTFGSYPISKATASASLKVAEICQRFGGTPAWVLPTTDETILILVNFKDGRQVKMEIEDEDAIGVARWDKAQKVTFHDACLSNIHAFVS